MPWPFSRKLSGKEAASAIDLIRHLQTQSALQQLAMEIYNDGMAMSAGVMARGDELFTRGSATMTDPTLVITHLLPASRRKVEIAEAMIKEHGEFDIAGAPQKAREAYDRQTQFVTVFRARAGLQLTCWRNWVDDPTADVSHMNSLDLAENQAMTTAIMALNALIGQAGLQVGAEPWLSINCAAFNDVRARVGLDPLTQPDFNARFLQGVAGGRARFFE